MKAEYDPEEVFASTTRSSRSLPRSAGPQRADTLPRRAQPQPQIGVKLFVFKAAVVGAGTMGGEIAQAIASADIPVVLKDVKQEFVDHGLEKAREVTKAQLDRLVAKEKLTQEQADARLEEVMGRIDGDRRATTASATSTS